MKLSKVRTRVLTSALFLYACSLSSPVEAQNVALHTDAWANGTWVAQSVVRNATGELHALSIEEVGGQRMLRLRHSTNGGLNWTVVSEPCTSNSYFNDSASGLDPTPAFAFESAVTIDAQERIHMSWGCYLYPTYYQQFYRCYDPATDRVTPIVSVTTALGSSTSTQTTANDLRVNEVGVVAMMAHGTSSWSDRLVQFDSALIVADVNPCLLTIPIFVDRGTPGTGSCQNARLAVDHFNSVHVGFYDNTSGGYYHRELDGITNTWCAPAFLLGDTVGGQDFYGFLASDNLGQVHAVYAKNTTPTGDWIFEYRRMEQGVNCGVWNCSTELMTFTAATHSGFSSYRIFNLGVDAITGIPYLVFRDLNDFGTLVINEIIETCDSGDPVFTPRTYVESAGTNPLIEERFTGVSLRGTLYPDFNQLQQDPCFHVTYQRRPLGTPTPPYDFRFSGCVSSIISFIRGDANDDGTTTIADAITLLNYVFLGGDPPACEDSADFNDDGGLDLGDAIYLINYLFIGGAAPPTPSAECGSDPTDDTLDCQVFHTCD